MAWLALTSSSAAAQDRGGRLRIPSSSGKEPGTPEPGLLGQCLPVFWTSHTGGETAGSQQVLVGVWGFSRAAWGPQMETCPHQALSFHEAPGPWNSTPKPPSLGTQELCLLQPRCEPGTKERNIHISFVIFPPTIRTGLAGASPLSHLSQQQLLNSTPTLNKVGVCSSQPHPSSPHFRGGSEALRLSFPSSCFCPDVHSQPRQPPLQTFPLGGMQLQLRVFLDSP